MVAKPSSTSSSSRRLPWAALAACALLLAADALVFRVFPPWAALTERIAERQAPHHQLARSFRDLGALAGAPPGAPRVAILGSSRADWAFDPEAAQTVLPEGHFAQVAYAFVGPFEMRALAEDLIAAGVDVAVLLASEFDTHRPVHVDPVPGTGAGSLSALAPLLREAGARFAWEQRVFLYRMSLSWLFDAYRFREVLRIGALSPLRSFELDPGRHGSRAAPLVAHAVAGSARFEATPEARAAALAAIPEHRRGVVEFQVEMLGDVSYGPHVGVQEALLRSAVAKLREAGVGVLLVEGPLHPKALPLIAPGMRKEFLALAQDLARQPGVRFLPREALPRFAERDFYDLLHLARWGAARFTTRVVRQVQIALRRPADEA